MSSFKSMNSFQIWEHDAATVGTISMIVGSVFKCRNNFYITENSFKKLKTENQTKNSFFTKITFSFFYLILLL